MRNKVLSLIMVFFIMIPLLSGIAYADGFEYECSTSNSQLNNYLEDEYLLATDNWKCPVDESVNGAVVCPDKYSYPIIVSFPMERKCDLDTKGNVVPGTCENVMSIHNNHRIGEMEDTGSELIAYVAGYTTVCSNKQLEMSDVDINIIDGKVKVTGVLSDDTAGWNVIFSKYKFVIQGFTGLCVLSCLLVFIISSIKLGSTAGNPVERKKVMTNMLISGLGTAGLGGALIFFGMFYNLV